MLTEIKHQIEGGLVTAVLTTDLQQVDDVLVVQQLEDPHLSQGRDGESLLLVLHQNFLQGDYFSSVRPTASLEDLPEGSLANLSNLLILVHPGAAGELELLDVSVLVLGQLGGRVLGGLVMSGAPRGSRGSPRCPLMSAAATVVVLLVVPSHTAHHQLGRQSCVIVILKLDCYISQCKAMLHHFTITKHHLEI